MNPGACGVSTCPISGNGDANLGRGFSIRIGPNDVTDRYHIRSGISLQSEINSRGACDFSIIDTLPSSVNLRVGDYVSVVKDGSQVFTGSVEEWQSYREGEASKIFRRIRSVDENAVADRRVVNAAYENMTAGDVVRRLIDDFLSDENITAGDIQDGATIQRIVFAYRPLSVALDTLGELSGDALSWHIDSFKRLHFVGRGQIVAPWSIDSSSNPTRKMRIRKSRHSLRNRQILRGGRDRTDIQTDSFVGDGTNRSFSVRFDVAEKPSKILVNSVEIAQTDIGVSGIDEGKKFYFNKGSKLISQDTDEQELLATDTLVIEYVGLFRIVSIRENLDSIFERRAIEGGSGIYEDVQTDTEIESSAFSTQRCEGLLERYSSPGVTIEYETDKAGLQAHQLQFISDPALDISGQFLLIRVEASDRGDMYHDRDGYGLRYKVQASSAGRFGSWIEFWRRLFDANKRTPIDEDATLDLTTSEVNVVGVSDTFSTTLSEDLTDYGLDPHSVFIVGEGVIGKSLLLSPEKLPA